MSRISHLLWILAIGLVSLIFPMVMTAEVTWTAWAITYFFFLALTLGIHFLAHRIANHPNLNAFTWLIMGSVFFKLFLSIALVWAMVRITSPEGHGFLFLFFFLYVSFTLYEIFGLRTTIHRSTEKRARVD